MASLSLFAEIHQPTRGIGAADAFPWGRYRLPPDIELLRELARESTVVVGNRTYHDIQGELPDDCFPIVLTKDLRVATSRPNFLRTAHSIPETLDLIDSFPLGGAVIVGGESIFRAFLPYVSELYITFIHGKTLASPDCFFPSFERDFALEHERTAGCYQALSYRHCLYKRARPHTLQ